MSSNVITVYGIAGASGSYLSQAFDGWKRRTLTLSQKQIARRQFEQLFARLPKRAAEPPVVFYRSYADTWSAPGMLLDAAFSMERKQFKEVQFDTWAVCASARTIENELPRVRQLARKVRGREHKERRWFFSTLIDCHEAMASLGGGYLFIHFKPIGMSIDDGEIFDSLEGIPAWIRDPATRTAE